MVPKGAHSTAEAVVRCGLDLDKPETLSSQYGTAFESGRHGDGVWGGVGVGVGGGGTEFIHWASKLLRAK